MEALEFFQQLFATSGTDQNQQEPEPNQQEPEPNQQEPEPNQQEPDTSGNKPAEPSKEDLRMMVREELKSLFEEAKQQAADAQKTARAAGIGRMPDKNNERTVDDIMAERFKNVMGFKEKEKK